MSIVSNLIDRLKEDGTPFRVVEGIADLASIKSGRPTTWPIAYVFVKEEGSSESERAMGSILQRMEMDVAIVIYTENKSGHNNASAAQDIEALKAYVRTKLLGFKPDTSIEAMQHVQGEIIRANEGGVWHEDIFATATYLEEASS